MLGPPALYFSCAKISSMPSRTASDRVLLCASQNAWSRLSVSASIRAFTSIPFGLSDFGRPVRGLKSSPTFFATKILCLLCLKKSSPFHNKNRPVRRQDLTKRGVYDKIKIPHLRMGRKVRCYIKAVGPPLSPPRRSKQGEVVADGKRCSEVYLSSRGVRWHCLVDNAPHRPKSVLAARTVPERLTLC